jgi:putative ABC transport system ATP-binding protein
MNTPFIQITDLHKAFDMGAVSVRALSGVDLAIERNTFCLVMGPSGSGKSTLLYLLGGLDRPTAGQIHVDGQAVEGMDENKLARYRRHMVGIVFQSFNLVPSMTALENVAFPMRFNGVSRRKRKERALDLLARVGLEDRAYHRPTELSGGEQQRVAIARAMVNNPQIIMADEPTGNLDTASGNSIMQVLADLHRNGATIVMVTHDTRLVQYATRLVQLLDGRIVNQAPG